MTKKKANTREIAAKRKADIKLLDERFLERVTIIGRALIGDTFELIPPQILRHMAFCRAPRLKAKAEEGSYIPKEIVIKYNELLLEFIKEDTIESYSGVEIPLDWYLSEGLMLVNYFHQLMHLVPFDLASGKIGYLLCRWCERKIIITTFLFLTNDGTPEGKKLEELTMLKKMDKQHLQIDTVQHFLSYHIDRNEELKSLFIEAGCGS
jgi:hypothetical protein